MTCSKCARDDTTYPKTTEWGPLLWKILHTLAEKAGKQSDAMMQADEMRGWPLLLKTFVAILPCEECRNHATTYIQEHPFEAPASYPAWNLYVRTYFYTFHEEVNARLGKPSVPFSSLADTYKSTSELTRWTNELGAMMIRAMKLNGMHIKTWQTWLNHLRMLRATMGL
jgi:hypothetical protein